MRYSAYHFLLYSYYQPYKTNEHLYNSNTYSYTLHLHYNEKHYYFGQAAVTIRSYHIYRNTLYCSCALTAPASSLFNHTITKTQQPKKHHKKQYSRQKNKKILLQRDKKSRCNANISKTAKKELHPTISFHLSASKYHPPTWNLNFLLYDFARHLHGHLNLLSW